MRTIGQTRGQQLVWVQISRRKRAFELRSGDEVVGTLRFQRGSLADAEMAGHRWTFKREGFWHPRVTVRVAGSDTDFALFRPSWVGGGSLELAQGRLLRLSAVNVWRSEWAWQERKQAPLVRIKARHGVLKARALVDILPDGAGDPDLPLLVLLGWYLMLLHSDDAAASSAATVAATSS